MAIGAVCMMGINFPENLISYISKSPREFGKDGIYHYLVGLGIIFICPLGLVRSTTGGLASATQRHQEVTRNSTVVLFLSWSIMVLVWS